MKKWKDMSFEDRNLFMLQCYEAGYNFSVLVRKCDMLEGLKVGYDNDPEWFQVEIEDGDWDNALWHYANVLAASINFDVDYDFFLKKVNMSVNDAAIQYMLDFHQEGLAFDDEDIKTYIEDLYSKKI